MSVDRREGRDTDPRQRVCRVQVRAIGSTEILPEFIIDVTTRASLESGPSFGELYAASNLKAANDRTLQVGVPSLALL